MPWRFEVTPRQPRDFLAKPIRPLLIVSTHEGRTPGGAPRFPEIVVKTL
jgi:hypothetical protein